MDDVPIAKMERGVVSPEAQGFTSNSADLDIGTKSSTKGLKFHVKDC